MEAALNGPLGRMLLGPAIVTIGRVPGNSLVVNDPKASSHHAEIQPERQGYSITDLGSTNGTCVNGTFTKSATSALFR
jgi:pSer/pThr/pTyr-binding forkhead associated (FHA) protein